MATARQLWGFVRPHRLGFFLSTITFTLASFTEPLVPAILSVALDMLSMAGGVSSAMPAQLQELSAYLNLSMDKLPFWGIPLALVVVFLVRGGFLFCGSYLLSWAATRTVFDMRTRLIESVIRADASLFNDLNPGIAITKVVTHPQLVTNMLGGALTTLLRDGTTVLAMLGYLFYLDWRLTLLAFLILPLMALVIKVIHARANAMGSLAYNAELQLISAVDDITRAWRVVRTFDAGEWEKRRFEKAGKYLQRMMLKSASASSLMSPMSQAIASLGLAGILGMALVRAQSGHTTAGNFAAFILAMLSLLSSVRRLTDISQPIVGGLITAKGCFDLMDTPREPDQGSQELASCHGEIQVEDVQMTYPGAETPALDHMSLSIPAGQTIALVGASGSGKTSLVSALLGFVSPQGGRITLDGIDIQDLRKASLRRQFAVVSQDIVLFDGTLADNVAYAQEKDPVKLEQCLRAANLWTFVSAQSQGWDMIVGTNGSKLSGGQRQRLAIARALYKEAPVWIFDEATSALDTESERTVQQAIEDWQGRKTLILIAHRLSTVVNADCICVISNGQVVESGRHSELMALNRAYANMVRAQATH
jgi:subfamily B ATP-binding cassette protein MsbA